MKKIITSTAAAAMLTFSVAPAAQAMDNEINALTGAIYNGLSGMQMDLAMINDLTLGQIHTIGSIMKSGDSEAEKKAKIDSILRQAAAN